MTKADYVIVVILMLVVVIATKYFQSHESELQVLDLPTETDVQPVIVEVDQPTIRYPVTESPSHTEQPIPEAETIQPQSQQKASREDSTNKNAETEPESEKSLPTLEHSDNLVRQDLYTLGQKILIRIGLRNATRAKSKLRELRQLLARG